MNNLTLRFGILMLLWSWVGAGMGWAAPGDLDALNAQMTNGTVKSVVVQPDGKIVIGGTFTMVRGVGRANLARLNADGTLDSAFNANIGGEVSSMALQRDGKIIVVGWGMARFHTNGTPDISFTPVANFPISNVTVQEDGKVLIVGQFTTIQGTGAPAAVARQYVARLEANGSLDAGFNPKPNNSVFTAALQKDGKIILGGMFTNLQPTGAVSATPRSRLARLEANGSLDEAFDPKANASVYSVVVQPDGRILVGGPLTSLQPNGAEVATPVSYFARLHADGALDTGYFPRPSNWVRTMALQADGRLIIGGDFGSVTGHGEAVAAQRSRIARLNVDGTVDATYAPLFNAPVVSLALQADGKTLVGGDFSSYQPIPLATSIPRRSLARLDNDAVLQTLSTPAAGVVRWQRGGAAPEVTDVTFELSSDGGAGWSVLGAGTRVGATAEWQWSGAGLPASGQLRARARVTGGYQSGGSGFIEQTAAFPPPPPPYAQWRLAELGDAEAPDDGNTDQDAYVNLAEYGLVLDAQAFDVGPVGARFTYPEGERLRLVFTRDPARYDVTITVLAADDLTGPWTTIASSVLGGVTTGAGYYGGDSAGPGLKTVEVRDLYPIGDPAHPRRFLRLRVSR